MPRHAGAGSLCVKPSRMGVRSRGKAHPPFRYRHRRRPPHQARQMPCAPGPARACKDNALPVCDRGAGCSNAVLASMGVLGTVRAARPAFRTSGSCKRGRKPAGQHATRNTYTQAHGSRKAACGRGVWTRLVRLLQAVEPLQVLRIPDVPQHAPLLSALPAAVRRNSVRRRRRAEPGQGLLSTAIGWAAKRVSTATQPRGFKTIVFPQNMLSGSAA